MTNPWLLPGCISVALVVGFGAGVAMGVPEAASGIADWITAVAAMLALALGYLTIRRQQREALAQRQADTLQRLDAEYDAVRFDIQQLHREVANGGPGAPKEITKTDEIYFYRRFFIALENCVRCYRLGLLPKSELASWASSLVTRFATEECLVFYKHPNPELKENFRAHWNYHRAHSVGDKHVFNTFIDDIWAEADRDRWKSLTRPFNLDENARRELEEAGERIVSKIEMVKS